MIDHELIITNTNVGWPGCTHDARVLRNSTIYENAAAFFDDENFIIGDSAYPLHRWLITPFRDNGHLNAQQTTFNRRISSVRQNVERAIGHMKGRFRRLREIPFHNAEEICNLITVGCIMHNLCIMSEEDIEYYIDLQEVLHPNAYENIFPNEVTGVALRDRLVQLLNN